MLLIIDGQGGRIGRALAEAVLENRPECGLSVIGTNAIATANMMKRAMKFLAILALCLKKNT